MRRTELTPDNRKPVSRFVLTFDKQGGKIFAQINSFRIFASPFQRCIVSKFIQYFDIQFSGLKPGTHEYEFEIGKTFFEAFEYQDIQESDLHVKVLFDKRDTMLVLNFELSGWIEAECARCTERYKQPIDGSYQLIVKFGDEEFNTTDDILILPHGEHTLNVAKSIYEFILLSVPARLVHPAGECNEEMIKKLESLKPKAEEMPEDPRWEALRKLK